MLEKRELGWAWARASQEDKRAGFAPVTPLTHCKIQREWLWGLGVAFPSVE